MFPYITYKALKLKMWQPASFKSKSSLKNKLLDLKREIATREWSKRILGQLVTKASGYKRFQERLQRAWSNLSKINWFENLEFV